MKNKNKKKLETASVQAHDPIIYEKQNTWFIILAFIIPFLVYIKTIKFGFVNFDDDSIIINQFKFLKNTSNLWQAFKTDAFLSNASPFYRPLQTFTYIIDTQFVIENQASAYHFTNTLLLGFIGLALYQFLLKLGNKQNLALAAAVFYCVHPLFVSTIAWIPSRGDLLLTLFCLQSFNALLSYLKTVSIFHQFIHFLCFFLALMSKETAAFFPAIYLLFMYFKKQDNSKIIKFATLYVVMGMIWFFIRKNALSLFKGENDELGIGAIFKNFRAIPEAISKFCFPFLNGVLPKFTWFYTIGGVLLLIILIFLVLKSTWLQKSEKWFYLAWFLLFLAPSMLYFHPLIDFLDHRLFLPLIGILCILVKILNHFQPKYASQIVWVMTIIFGITTFIKSEAYAKPEKFYHAAVEKNPTSALAQNNLGFVISKSGKYQESLPYFEKAISIQSDYYEAFFNLAYAKLQMLQYAEAIPYFDKSISLKTDYALPYFYRALANMKLKKYKEAIQDYEKFNTLKPNTPESYDNLAQCYGFLNDFKNALVNINKAIEISPETASYLGNRAIVKQYLKDYQGALDDCNSLLKINPNNTQAQNFRKTMMITLGIK